MTRNLCCAQDEEEAQKQSGIAQRARNKLGEILAPGSVTTTAALVDKATKDDLPQYRTPRIDERRMPIHGFARAENRQEYPEKQALWSNLAISQFIARRCGLDFVGDSVTKEQILASTVEVSASVILGDARLPSTYTGVNALLQNSPVDLVILDPPFGEGKHARGETWDSEDNRWEPSPDLFDYLAPVKLNKECLVVAVYTRYQDIGHWIEALEQGSESTGGAARGNVLFTLMRDGPTQMRSGTASPGSRTFLLAMKYGNGAEAVKVDQSRLGGRFWYSFPPPEAASKYGRLDIDAELRHEGAAVNPTQKSVEETRMLVRTLCPGGGAVLSLCNGTGTALIASCLEGRMCVGVDNSKRQCEWCSRRLRVFANRELLLAAALRDGTDPASQSFEEMQQVAKMKILPDTQVSCRTNVGDVLAAVVCIQSRLRAWAYRQDGRSPVCRGGLRVRDHARAMPVCRMPSHRAGSVARPCAGPTSCASRDTTALNYNTQNRAQ